MAKGTITKTSVDNLKCSPEKDREILWDENLKGFGVAAFRNGGKVYLVQYRQHGRSRRSTIGMHGKLTPDEARREAKKVRGRRRRAQTPLRSGAKNALSARFVP
jgi:hypothetical protein